MTRGFGAFRKALVPERGHEVEGGSPVRETLRRRARQDLVMERVQGRWPGEGLETTSRHPTEAAGLRRRAAPEAGRSGWDVSFRWVQAETRAIRPEDALGGKRLQGARALFIHCVGLCGTPRERAQARTARAGSDKHMAGEWRELTGKTRRP